MPQYVLPVENLTDWEALDKFTKGYVEAMFFTSVEPSTTRHNHLDRDAFEGRIAGLPGDYGFDDLAHATLASIKRECSDFQDRARHLLDAAYRCDYDARRAGHDFWMSRCGYGVGYQDRKELRQDGDTSAYLPGALSAVATREGERCVYMGDDGLVYMM